ncbi:MAG: M15 family metallopeptidase [Rickettsiales bacterium]
MLNDIFTVRPLSDADKASIRACGAWKEGAPLPLERLRSVRVAYVDFNGEEHADGDVTVADAAADAACEAFRRLFEMRFPINSIRPIHCYAGDDDASMEDNNSSAFNYRRIAVTNVISMHSYGLAIDVNPEQNPYGILGEDDTHEAQFFPKKGKRYLNRTHLRPGMVEPIVGIFRECGFTEWGGHWDSPLDWHHFQTARPVAEMIAAMAPDDAKTLFTHTRRHPSFMRDADAQGTAKEIVRYRADPLAFMATLSR